MSQFWSPTPGATPPSAPSTPLLPPGPGSLTAPAPRLPPRQIQPSSPTPPGPPPVTPPPRRGPSPDARNALIIAAAVAAVVLLFAASFTWVVDRPGDEAASTPTTAPPTGTQPTSPSTAPEAPPESPSAAPPTTVPAPTLPEGVVIPELQQFVATQRGLAFREDVPVYFLDDQTFGQQIRSSLPPGYIDQMLWLFQTLGLVSEENPDAAEQLEQLVVDSIIGFYYPDDGRLVVRGTERSAEVDTTIVHELTHALDDQWFNLSRPELTETLDESLFGFESLVEGSAEVVEEAYLESLGLSAREGPADSMLGAIFSEYARGKAFVEALLDAGGTVRVDEAFGAPARTSKEIIEPDRYLEGFVPTPVEPPPAGGEIIDEGLFGQLYFTLMFELVAEPADAEELASTWTGDWHVIWVDGLEQCLRVDVALESPEAATMFAEALRAWAVSQDDAVVEELSSGLVRLTNCSPRPPPPPGSTSPA